MNTRMSKYYYDSVEDSKRSVRNKDLYQKMYDEVEYSNIEGIASIEKTNEIDLNKIREMLRQNEDKKQVRVFEDLPTVKVEDEEELRNYDIKDILDKAKSNREADNSNHHLSNTQYDILKKINLKDNLEEEYLNASGELKELINTITNTSILNKMGDKELSLNMFEELDGEDNTIVSTVKVEKVTDKTKELDKSFYTSSLNFNNDDFEDLKEMNDTMKKNNFLIKVLIGLLFVVIAAVLIYIAIKFPIV